MLYVWELFVRPKDELPQSSETRRGTRLKRVRLLYTEKKAGDLCKLYNDGDVQLSYSYHKVRVSHKERVTC